MAKRLAKLRQVDLAEWRKWWKHEGRDGLNALLTKEWDPLLTKEWDPVGADVPEDEYEGYALQLGRLLREDASAIDIATYLAAMRVESLGVGPDPDNDLRVAHLIVVWYERVMGRAS